MNCRETQLYATKHVGILIILTSFFSERERGRRVVVRGQGKRAIKMFEKTSERERESEGWVKKPGK